MEAHFVQYRNGYSKKLNLSVCALTPTLLLRSSLPAGPRLQLASFVIRIIAVLSSDMLVREFLDIVWRSKYLNCDLFRSKLCLAIGEQRSVPRVCFEGGANFGYQLADLS
jgi:hypothetical protein